MAGSKKNELERATKYVRSHYTWSDKLDKPERASAINSIGAFLFMLSKLRRGKVFVLLTLLFVALMYFVLAFGLRSNLGAQKDPNMLSASSDWPVVSANSQSVDADYSEAVYFATPVLFEQQSGTLQFNKYWMDIYLAAIGRQHSNCNVNTSSSPLESTESLYAAQTSSVKSHWRCDTPETPHFCHFKNVYVNRGQVILYVDQSIELSNVVELNRLLQNRYGLSVRFNFEPLEDFLPVEGWSVAQWESSLETDQTVLDEVLRLGAMLYTVDHLQKLEGVAAAVEPHISRLVSLVQEPEDSSRSFLSQLLCSHWANLPLDGNCKSTRLVSYDSKQVFMLENLVLGHHKAFDLDAQTRFFHQSDSREIQAPLTSASQHAAVAKQVAHWIASLIVRKQTDIAAKQLKVCYSADSATVLNSAKVDQRLQMSFHRISGNVGYQSFKAFKLRSLDGWLSTLIQLQECSTFVGSLGSGDALFLFLLVQALNFDTSYAVIELQSYSSYHLNDHTLMHFSQWFNVRHLAYRPSDLSSVRFIANPQILLRLKELGNSPTNLFSLPRKQLRPRAVLQRIQSAFVEQFEVDLILLDQLLKLSGSLDTKFLLYMPWEQLNNQLVELKSACAVARLLDRTLVLPPVGQRKLENAQWDFSFSISEFRWESFDRYFDVNYALHNLPCKAVTLKTFFSIRANDATSSVGACRDVNIKSLHFNPFATATVEGQLSEYYRGLLGLCVPPKAIVNDGRRYQLTSDEVIDLYGKNNEKQLALGSMFWYYGFERNQPYPLKAYVDYMSHEGYARTVEALKFLPLVSYLVSYSVKHIVEPFLKVYNTGYYATWRRNSAPPRNRFFFAIHVRRGDYWNKCKKIRDVSLQRHCFPSIDDIASHLDEVYRRTRLEYKDDARYAVHAKPLVYIATNLESGKQEFEALSKSYHLLFFDDVFSVLYGNSDYIKSKLTREIISENIYTDTNKWQPMTEALEKGSTIEVESEVKDQNEELALREFDDTIMALKKAYGTQQLGEGALQQKAQELEHYKDWLKVLFKNVQLDSIEKAFLDVQLCSSAIVQEFIGNFYSSFSRTIMERRSTEQLKSNTF